MISLDNNKVLISLDNEKEKLSEEQLEELLEAAIEICKNTGTPDITHIPSMKFGCGPCKGRDMWISIQKEEPPFLFCPDCNMQSEISREDYLECLSKNGIKI